MSESSSEWIEGHDTITFVRQEDGSVLVDKWPKRVLVSDAALFSGSLSPYLEFDGKMIRIRSADSTTSYRIAERWPDEGIIGAVRVQEGS